MPSHPPSPDAAPMLTTEPTRLLEQQLQALRDRLRLGQRRIADWQGGPLAISAVPGSGKSTGMAIATAILLGDRYQQALLNKSLPADQIVLVTFTRAAAANLRGKIRELLKELGLPASGFAVYTLHGLALSIANRYPDLSGLNLDRMTLVSPTQSHRLIRTIVEQWITANPALYRRLIEGNQFDGEETERLRRQSVLRTEVLPNLAQTVIHEAKSSGLMPSDLRELSQIPRRSAASAHSDADSNAPDYDVLSMAAGLYEQYQILLQQRNFLDYDDMILAALRVLENDSARQVWQTLVFAVFEDEAQDSSPLQTLLLELLAAEPNSSSLNLVRVGDPNQAINSTFTPADPLFFREFCQQCDQQGRLAEMDQAGRSTQVIMDAANFTLEWVNRRYAQTPPKNTANYSSLIPYPSAFSLPFRPQQIHPVAANDPQPDRNPPPEGGGLELRFPPDVYQSVALIAQRVAALFEAEPTARAAVLVRENRQGRFVADLLRHPEAYKLGVDLSQLGIEIYDVGERDRHSHVPAEVLALLQFLDRPHSPDNLKAALRVLVDRQLIPTQDLNQLSSQPEQFLYPGPLDAAQLESVLKARRYCNSLLRARLELPQYQLIPFLGLTLRYDQTELATADKLAARIAQQTANQPSLMTMLDALQEVVRGERFEPVETGDLDARYTRPGQLTIMTMHKAKGLDWDFVFLPFLHEQLIPGSVRVLPQSQFLGNFDLAEVTRAQIRASIHQLPLPSMDVAWTQAGHLKVAEEFRLLYVAMTRAKRLLWMAAEREAPFTWNKPENLERKEPCPVLPALSQAFPRALQ